MKKKRIVLRASTIGYCMGVRRAVDSAIQARKDNPTSNIFTLGELIHNPTTLQNLYSLGISVVKEEDCSTLKKGDIVIIRAHGTSPQILSLLAKKNVTIIDSTCPHVVSNRKLAQECGKKGLVILAGDKNHPEVKGIKNHVLESSNSSCIIIENAEEASKISSYNGDSPVFLIAQTTIKEEEFNSIKDVLANKIKNLKIFNTICSATNKRQAALKELSKKVDTIIVIGGKNSANTRRLFTTCQENKISSFFIEDIKELVETLPKDFYSFKRIGLASGASTPDEVIDSIEEKLYTLSP